MSDLLGYTAVSGAALAFVSGAGLVLFDTPTEPGLALGAAMMIVPLLVAIAVDLVRRALAARVPVLPAIPRRPAWAVRRVLGVPGPSASVWRHADQNGVEWSWRIDKDRRGSARTALEAIEAAELAAKESK